MAYKITKAVVAAAGRGTRFLPVTKAYPKELLPVWDRPAIHWLIEELVAAGIEEVLIVHRHGCPDLKRYFSPDPDLDAFLKIVGKEAALDEWREVISRVKLDFRPQPRSYPYGTGTPIMAAKTFIGSDPFVYVYGDDLVAEKKVGQYVRSLIELFQAHQADGVIGCQKVPWSQVSGFGVLDVMEDGKGFFQLRRICEKVARTEAPSNLAYFGRLVLPARVIGYLEDQELSRVNELFVTDTVNRLASEGVVLTKPVTGEWVTIGNPDQWLAANEKFVQLFG